MPLTGVNLHTHWLGPIRHVPLSPSARLRYVHFSYTSTQEVLEKKVLRNRNGLGTPSALVAANASRADEYFNLVRDEALARFAPLLRHCIEVRSVGEEACGRSRRGARQRWEEEEGRGGGL